MREQTLLDQSNAVSSGSSKYDNVEEIYWVRKKVYAFGGLRNKKYGDVIQNENLNLLVKG